MQPITNREPQILRSRVKGYCISSRHTLLASSGHNIPAASLQLGSVWGGGIEYLWCVWGGGYRVSMVCVGGGYRVSMVCVGGGIEYLWCVWGGIEYLWCVCGGV